MKTFRFSLKYDFLVLEIKIRGFYNSEIFLKQLTPSFYSDKNVWKMLKILKIQVLLEKSLKFLI